MSADAPGDRDGETIVSPRRRMPAQERRTVVLEAALRTFASNGYDGTSMDEIASAAGVSKAVVYDHVASKRELYTVLLDAIRGELVAVVEAALASTAEPGEPRVRAAVEAIFAFVEQQPEACRLLVLELQGAARSSIGQELEDRIADAIADTLDEARLFAGHPRRRRQLAMLAELLKSAVIGLASWWFRNPAASRTEVVQRAEGVVWPAIERAARG